MRARVTLTRAVRQYLDVEIGHVESLEEAAEQIAETLAHPDRRARLLHGLLWFGTEIEVDTDITVVEVVSLDK